jgi:hypothetical protein
MTKDIKLDQMMENLAKVEKDERESINKTLAEICERLETLEEKGYELKDRAEDSTSRFRKKKRISAISSDGLSIAAY